MDIQWAIKQLGKQKKVTCDVLAQGNFYIQWSGESEYIDKFKNGSKHKFTFFMTMPMLQDKTWRLVDEPTEHTVLVTLSDASVNAIAKSVADRLSDGMKVTF